MLSKELLHASMVLFRRCLFRSVLDRRVSWRLLRVRLRNNSWIRLWVNLRTLIRWISIKSFYITIRIHAGSIGISNVSSGFCSCLNLRIDIFCPLRCIAHYGTLWKLTVLLYLNQSSNFWIIIILFFFNIFLNWYSFWVFLRLIFLFWTLSLK